MTTGLQTAPAAAPELSEVLTPSVDRNSLKTVMQVAGVTALAGGGAALLLYTLMRPKPEYEPKGGDRIVRRQAVEEAIPLRVQRSLRPTNPDNTTGTGLFSNPDQDLDQETEDRRQGTDVGAGETELLEPEFSDDFRRASRDRNRPGRALGTEGASANALSDEVLDDQQLEAEIVDPATSEEDLAGPMAGPMADAFVDPQTEGPLDDQAEDSGASDDAVASEEDVAPPDVSAWLEGPVATLEELPLLPEQADTLPQELPEAPLAAAPPTPKDGIYVEDFQISGNRVFPAEQLAQIARAAVFPEAAEGKDGETGSQVGRVLSPAELVQASDAITEFYTQQGYVNSGAFVPEAVLSGAPPEIRIIEGQLESINVTVKPPNSFGLSQPLSENYIEGRLARAGSGTLNLDRLVDGVRLLELDPLIESISTELVPGSVTGSSVLNVEVQQAKTFAGAVSLNNFRSPSIGSFTQGFSLQQSNILGRGDNALFGFSRSNGSSSLDFGYSLPINAKDGTISLRHSRNSSRVIEDPFSALDAVSRSRRTELKLRQPLVKKPDTELAASLTLSRYFSEASILDDLPLTSSSTNEDGETRISALRFGQEWSKKGEKQFTALQSEFSLGLGSLLGGDVRSEGQDSRFFAWRGKGRLVRALGPDAIASLKGEVQLAANSLVPVERFSVGGPTTVRGYRQNTNLTDSGWLISAETQLPVLRLPKLKSVVQLAPFVDVGRGWNVSGDQPEQGFLASTGIGAILRVGDDFSARLDYGIPLTPRDNVGDSLQESGLSFSINLTPF